MRAVGGFPPASPRRRACSRAVASCSSSCASTRFAYCPSGGPFATSTISTSSAYAITLGSKSTWKHSVWSPRSRYVGLAWSPPA